MMNDLIESLIQTYRSNLDLDSKHRYTWLWELLLFLEVEEHDRNKK